MKGSSANSIICNMAPGRTWLRVSQTWSLAPSELNFALEGNANCTFEDNYGGLFSGSMVLRVGEGREINSLSNNSIGSKEPTTIPSLGHTEKGLGAKEALNSAAFLRQLCSILLGPCSFVGALELACLADVSGPKPCRQVVREPLLQSLL